MSKLGIIAGAGELPGILAAACQESGRAHYILGLRGFADNAHLPRAADAWINLGEVGKGIDGLKEAGVKDVVMAGAVRRPVLSALKVDLKGMAFLARMAGRVLGDDGLLRAVISELEIEGFRVVGVDQVISGLLAPKGTLGCVEPDAAAIEDIACGVVAAKKLGAADVGQSVIVQQGVVLDIEDSEGTDALIRRAAILQRGGSGGILVKVKKPIQERRADLPVIGKTTVVNAAAAGLRGIAVEAGETLILDRTAVINAANDAGLFVVGVEHEKRS